MRALMHIIEEFGFSKRFFPPLQTPFHGLFLECASPIFIGQLTTLKNSAFSPASPSADSQTCLCLIRAVLVVGGPQLYGEDDEAGAQREGGSSEAAAAGAEGTATGPSGRNREETRLNARAARGRRRPEPGCSL